MAEWKKVVVSGSDISQLNNDAGYITDVYNGFATASFVYTGGANLILASSPTSSLNFASSSGQGLTISTNQLGAGQAYEGFGFTFGLSDIPNTSLAYSSIMLDGTSYALGASGSILDGSGVWSGSAQLPVGIVSGAAVTFNEQGAFTASFNDVETPIDLGLMVDDSPTFANLTLTGDLSVAGNLTVTGTTTMIETTNLRVTDAWIHLNSGSGTSGNAGIIAENEVDGKGSAFGFDTSAGPDAIGRWGFSTGSADATNNTVTFDAYASAVVIGTDNTPVANLTANHYSGSGNMFIGTDSTIWIYA